MSAETPDRLSPESGEHLLGPAGKCARRLRDRNSTGSGASIKQARFSPLSSF